MSCPSLESQYSTWLHYKRGDTVKFINDNGSEIIFNIIRNEVSPISVRCNKDGYGGCHCNDCGEPHVGVYGETKDTSRQYIYQGNLHNSTNFSVYISKRYRQQDTSTTLQYTILNHSNLIKIGPTLTLNQSDSLFSTFTAGTTIYTNVIMHQIDTLSSWAFIWKTYYSKDYGIIAFYDRTTQSLFYRKP